MALAQENVEHNLSVMVKPTPTSPPTLYSVTLKPGRRWQKVTDGIHVCLMELEPSTAKHALTALRACSMSADSERQPTFDQLARKVAVEMIGEPGAKKEQIVRDALVEVARKAYRKCAEIARDESVSGSEADWSMCATQIADAIDAERDRSVNLSQRLHDQTAFVERALGESVICETCGATLSTYADACTASLSCPCPGFCAIEQAKKEFSDVARKEAK